ncbi:hypothetical protein H0H87_012527 [Tephrocybe sp. NHM501043]|nr:hypothetical protein H0H87_012527 [Tephrocybe sp. NHM501043]
MESSKDGLLPRRYQEEVFARAQAGNIIAALNTGSGKTLISLLLIRWISSLEASKEKIIIFLVPKVALVEQQGNYISHNTPLRVIKLHGALEIDLTDRAQWKKRFEDHDVFVMTVIGVRAHLDELHEQSPKPVEIIKAYPSPPETYTDFPSPSLWSCLQVFEKNIWTELDIPWNAIELRYHSTLHNLGPYAASMFLYDEIEQHILCVRNTYMDSTHALEYAAEMGLPSQVKLKPLPPEFWQIQQIHIDFGGWYSLERSTSDLSIPLEWCTPKIRVLVALLLAYHTPEFQGIVFVEQRQTATCLASILPMISQIKGLIRCGALMGHGVNSDGITKATPASHKNTVESFRRGDINILIATSVAEEGLDFPACDLVIRFDPLAHMVAYVQSRGRARNKTSTFIVMIQQGDTTHLSRYHTLKMAEPEVNKIYQSRNAPPNHVFDEDAADDIVGPADLSERERYVVESSGAVLTYDNSISLLNRLCSLIPRDAFTPPHVPSFSGDYEATLNLPSSIPLPANDLTFTGPPRRNKKEARRAVAFMAVKRLHVLDVFDDFLLPISRSKGKKTEDADGRPMIDVSEVPIQMDVFVKDPWTTGRALWIHPVYIDNQLAAGLVTGTQLRAVNVFCNSSVHTAPGRPMVFEDGQDEAQKRRLMLEFTKLGIWLRITARPFNNTLGLFLVPLTASHEVDFDVMELLVAGPRGYSDWSVINDNDFGNLMIMNMNQFGKPLLLRKIRDDLTLSSAPPPGSREHGHSTYHHYFTEKWTRKTWVARLPSAGPLLEAQILPRSFDGGYPLDPTSAGALNTVPDGLVAPRDCCLWLAMSPNVRRAYEILPALCHRITDIYRVDRARFELGLPPIKEDLLVEALTIPSADAGYSNQRLETLGDAVLKLCTSVHLYNKYPHRHEGQLSILRQSSVSNFFLLARAKEIQLETYVSSECRSVHTWRYVESVEKSVDPFAERCTPRQYPRRSLQDCMEALLGASFLTGGIPIALHTGTALGLSLGGPIPWPIRYSRNPKVSPVSRYFAELEERLGYTFHRRELLVEAVTHPSISSTSGGPSYQRLEFLGDGQDIVERGWKYDPPKALSDAFESVMGAVLVDSAYNYDKAAAVVEHVMEDVISVLSPSIAWDPVTNLRQWITQAGCSKLTTQKKTRLRNGIQREGVAVLVHGTMIVGPIVAISQSVSKFVASERALALLRDSEGGAELLSQLCDCREDKIEVEPTKSVATSGSSTPASERFGQQDVDKTLATTEEEELEELEVVAALEIASEVDA